MICNLSKSWKKKKERERIHGGGLYVLQNWVCDTRSTGVKSTDDINNQKNKRKKKSVKCNIGPNFVCVKRKKVE